MIYPIVAFTSCIKVQLIDVIFKIDSKNNYEIGNFIAESWLILATFHTARAHFYIGRLKINVPESLIFQYLAY